MESLLDFQEEKNKKKGVRLSILFHIALVILALLPIITYPDPPPGQEGILVNLGLPDQGQGDENAAPAEPSEPAAEPTPPVEEPEPEPEPKEVKPEPKEEPKKVEKPIEKPVVTTEDPTAVALRKKQEEERKKQVEEETKKKAAEAEAKRKAEEESRKKAAAEAEQKRKESEAKDFGKNLGLEGLGKGKGNTGKPGNQGDPGGDPNASNLEGISTGVGKVSGGLGGRGIVASPKVNDNSQDNGTVVVRVCVNANGSVSEANFTQRGSTATSQRLINLAVANAKTWKFSAGDENQCGFITYTFKVS